MVYWSPVTYARDSWYSAHLSRQAYWRNWAASSRLAKNTIDSARRMRGRKKMRRSRSRRRISTKEHHKFQEPDNTFALNHQLVYVWNAKLYGYSHPPSDAGMGSLFHPREDGLPQDPPKRETHTTDDSYAWKYCFVRTQQLELNWTP